MRALALALALFVSTPAWAALAGVTEFKSSPERIADSELATLLDRHVAGADVIAIGETVHGSSEFLRMQTRLIQYLVTRHGLRLILWENPVERSLELTRWAVSCTQARTPAPVDVLYMPTAADVAFFDWLCDFNRARAEDPIVFRGIDVWDRPWEHYGRIRAFGEKVGAGSASVATIERSCPASRASAWPEVDAIRERMQIDRTVFAAKPYAECRTALTDLLAKARASGLDGKQKGAPSDDAFELAISASTLLGWLGFYHHASADDIVSWNERDMAQGRNIMLLMEKHGVRRSIVAAHTSHVSHNRSAADWWGFGDIKSGIHFFTRLTGKPVFNIALTAYEASGTQGAWSRPLAANSLDRRLADGGHAFSFFTSDAPFLSEHPTWWMQNQNFPGVYESGVQIVPRDHFDAVVFFRQSHVDGALPSRPMWEP